MVYYISKFRTNVLVARASKINNVDEMEGMQMDAIDEIISACKDNNEVAELLLTLAIQLDCSMQRDIDT